MNLAQVALRGARLSDPFSLWRPIVGDVGFLFALGFVGGAIGKKIEAVLIAAGASIARQSQGTDAVVLTAMDKSLLWQALGLHLVLVLVIYVLFCAFASIGWWWAVNRKGVITMSLYVRRFFGVHALLIPLGVIVDALGFWAEHQRLAEPASMMTTLFIGGYSAGLLMLGIVSVIASVRILRSAAWIAWKEAVVLLCSPRKSLVPVGLIVLGFGIINAGIWLASALDPRFGIVVGIGVLFPYLAFTRLFLVEVFG
ncbi:hypothetical protein HY641_00250 [Candidatus Woesearchaeota archaeon]|nr:hypothetical protein [Candidatus Woesearchaeota archaeon]